MTGIAVCGAQLPSHSRKAETDGVVIVEDQVGRPHEIEADDEQPKERTDPYREKGQHGEHASRQVPVGSEYGEVGGQIGAHHAWKDEDQPKESEAVQSRDGA